MACQPASLLGMGPYVLVRARELADQGERRDLSSSSTMSGGDIARASPMSIIGLADRGMDRVDELT